MNKLILNLTQTRTAPMMAAKEADKQADKLVEKVQENVVTSHMKGGTTTPSVPNLTCIVPCEDESHRVTPDLS